MKKALFIFLILSTTIANAQDSTYVVKWSNGKKGIEYNYTNSKKNGEWRNWNRKGELIFFGIYQDGNLVSKTTYDYYTETKDLLYEQKSFNANSTLIEHRKYLRENNDSYTTISYYDNGNKKSSGKILNGKKEGKWKFYKQDGSLEKNEKFKSNIQTNNSNNHKTNPNYNPKKEKYSKGFYIDENGNKIECYFKDGSFFSNKLRFKLEPNQKGKVLPLKNVLRINFEEVDYIVIGFINLKGCHTIGKGYYKNKIAKVLIEERISLYSAFTHCQMAMSPVSPGGAATFIPYSREVFIVKKGEAGDYQEVRVGNKKFRALIKSLVNDNEEIMKELNFEDITYNNLEKIIKKYNSTYK